MGTDHWRFTSAVAGPPGESWRAAIRGDPAGEGAYGIELVSRLPVLSWHELRLAAATVKRPS